MMILTKLPRDTSKSVVNGDASLLRYLVPSVSRCKRACIAFIAVIADDIVLYCTIEQVHTTKRLNFILLCIVAFALS
jgi:hypothetical protein